MKRILPMLAAVFCATFAISAAVPPAEKLLPDDTLVFFSVPDFAKAREAYSNSPQGQLWRDPSLKPFKDKFLDKFKQDFLTPLERDLGAHFEDYADLPQGQFTVALTQSGWQGKDKDPAEPGLLLLVDTKDKSSQLKTNLADLKKKWIDAGKTVRTEKIRDVEFSIITVSSNDLPKTLKKAQAAQPSDPPEPADNADVKKSAAKKEIYIGQSDSLLILGDSAKPIEKILTRMAGGDVKTVGDLSAYQANESVFRDAAAIGWVNTKVFVDILIHSVDTDSGAGSTANPMAFKPAKALKAVGLGGLKSLAFSYRYSDEGAQFTFFLGLPETERVGFFQILAGEPKEFNPPAFVPADAIKFQRWRIDGQKAWATIQKIINDISPQGLNSLNLVLTTAEAAAKEKDPNFDIKKYLFGNLGDDMISYSKAPKGDKLTDLSSPPSLFLLGSPNPEQLASGLRSISLLLGAPTGGPSEREFLGHKIYTMPAMPLGGAASSSRALSYVASGGYLAISTDNSMLEEYLRSSQDNVKSLKDAPSLGEATSKVAGTGTTMFGFSNDSEAMRATLEVLRKEGFSSSSPLAPLAAALGGDAKIKEWCDFSLLPTFDKIAKYFSFTVYGETVTADGVAFKGFTPTPPQLKK